MMGTPNIDWSDVAVVGAERGIPALQPSGDVDHALSPRDWEWPACGDPDWARVESPGPGVRPCPHPLCIAARAGRPSGRFKGGFWIAPAAATLGAGAAAPSS